MSPARRREYQRRRRQTPQGKRSIQMATARYLQTPAGKIMREGANRRTRERLRKRLDDLKSGPCMDCGGVFDPVCMDFDHRPGEIKLFTIASGAGRTDEVLLAEVAKCDLVCSNCHRIRSYRLRNHRTAGTSTQPPSQPLQRSLFDLDGAK